MTRQQTIVHVVGARPNYMKIAPVMDALRGDSRVRQVLVNTGQHYDQAMAGGFLTELQLPTPDHNLGVGSASHAVQTAKVMIAFEEICLADRPDLVVVVGDVNSTMAASLVAAKLVIPIAHVEAGLRSRDKYMPEEVNRIVTDRLADLLLTPSRDADENLRAEGTPAERIHFVGNVMIDTLRRHLPIATLERIRDRIAIVDWPYAVLTLHRPSNVDDRETFGGILKAVQQVAVKMPVIFPVHPRTRNRLREFGLEDALQNVVLTEPLGYVDFLALTSHARLILTDSGGLQEESTALGIPCLTLRDNTERPITVTHGTNRVVGTSTQGIVAGVEQVFASPPPKRIPELWDGHAAERIAGVEPLSVPVSEFFDRVRRASRKTPRQIVARLGEMAIARFQRPWAQVYPRLMTEGALLKAAGAPSIDALWQAQLDAPFFVSPSRRDAVIRAFRRRYPDAEAAILDAAERVLRHQFDLLGSGDVPLSGELPWHTDFKSGREWPVEYAGRMEYIEIDRPSDVKVPWELSRCQHFTTLGQAYWLTGDEKYAREFVDEVSDWSARNPWGYGVNWACAMDVALRAVSWIWAFYFFGESDACRSRAFRGLLLRALFMHGAFIATHLERGEANGNHYLCDAVGLVFLGTFFRATAKGREWLGTGREIVDTEIFLQTSVDGVDFEKSTAYHRLVLEAFLTSHLLLDRHDRTLPTAWTARLERMVEFVEAYTKPDGTVPLIGDADDGRVQKLGVQGINDHRYLLAAGAVVFKRGDFKQAAGAFGDEAFWLLGPEAGDVYDAVEAASTPITSKAFDGGGVYVLRCDRAHVIVDCGEVGMHGRGGHGHSDITSLEVWLAGMNLVSDCGAYLYTASREWRNRFRSTAFHNVLQVDGEELNRLISPNHLWQLRDDARPRDIAWRWADGADYFRGGHDGYARLDPPVKVTREVLLIKDGPDVLIRDSVGGSGSHDLVWRFHLDPAVRATIDHDDVRLRVGDREAWLQTIDPAIGSMVAIEDGWVSPSYGVRLKTQVVVITTRTSLPVSATYRIGLARMTSSPLRSLAAALPAAQSG